MKFMHKKWLLLPLFLVGCTASVSTEDADKLAVANEVIDAWNNMDWDRAWDTFAEDGVLHSVMSDPVVGKDAVSTRLSAVVDGLTRIELQIINMGIINDVVVLERVDDFDYKGKHSRVPVVGIMEISDGKVNEWREYYDKATLVEALTVEGDEASSFTNRTASSDINALTKKLSADWNKGDMAAYLAAYRRDDDIAVLFRDKILAGFDELEQLFTSTWTTEEAMGDFETHDVVVQLVGPGLAISKGQFEHQFPDEKVVGVFSHTWQQTDAGWKIIHEHTSRAMPE